MIRDIPVIQEIPDVFGGLCQKLGTKIKNIFLFIFIHSVYICVYVQSFLGILQVGSRLSTLAPPTLDAKIRGG